MITGLQNMSNWYIKSLKTKKKLIEEVRLNAINNFNFFYFVF